MSYGSKPVDGGNLILSTEEKNQLLSEYPESQKYIKKFIGSSEFIRGNERWCLWIENSELAQALKLQPIFERIEKVRELRLASSKLATQKDAEIAHRFGECRYKQSQSIIIPGVSSERREYIPIGFLDEQTVISNLANATYDAEPWIFGVLNSKMHMAWMRTSCGRLGTSYRYSSALCYNTFPIPNLQTQKEEITAKAMGVLVAREHHSGKTMAELYDPDKMPPDLRSAHNALDTCVDSLYRSTPFDSDEERLEVLFKLYEKMIKKEATKTEKKK